MRKFFSIFLIALLVFNVVGYYGLFLGMQYKNKKEMIQKLDAHGYREDQTITIKVPLTVPYATDSKDFERVDGEFQHDGEYYRLVKQRLAQDTLYIVCIRDGDSKQMNNVLGFYVKSFTDKPVDGQQNANPVPSFGKEYITSIISLHPQSAGWNSDLTGVTNLSIYTSGIYPPIAHPPEG